MSFYEQKQNFYVLNDLAYTHQTGQTCQIHQIGPNSTCASTVFIDILAKLNSREYCF
jgi:hypothetical protein